MLSDEKRTMLPTEFIQKSAAIVGKDAVLQDPALMLPYTRGFRYGNSSAFAVILPGSLLELWRTAQLCAAADMIIIAQAANTGITGGSTPEGDYDRPVVILSMRRLKGIHLIKQATQAVALPGASLFELEDMLAEHHREPHSVIGSSCIGASIIGGICNNSGGALIQRGPAYTELSLYAQLNAQGELELHNELGIELGDSPEEILQNLENRRYQDSDIRSEDKAASDREYEQRVRDVDADSPSRFNNDGRRLYGASGSAGKLIVFAVRIDTFPKPEREQVFYIGTNHPQDLTDIRRHILQHFAELPVSGEYIHRGFFDLAERYGRDTFRIIDSFGTKRIPAFFALKNTVDRLCAKLPFMPRFFADRFTQCCMNLLPSHLPAFMRSYRERFEHHLILKMSDSGIEAARDYLSAFFREREGDFYACNQKEGDKAILHRFVIGGATGRYWQVHHKDVGDIMSLDIALKRNESQWFEQLPPELDAQIEKRLYCGHFFCHVMHQDYILKKGANAEAIKAQLLAFFDSRGAEYPAEHNVGHLYHAKAVLRAFYQSKDPCNVLNPGIGKTPKGKHWTDCGC